jgi:hypothetical protein
MDAICSSETSVATQQTTRRHIPEDDTLQVAFLFHCRSLCIYSSPGRSAIAVILSHAKLFHNRFLPSFAINYSLIVSAGFRSQVSSIPGQVIWDLWWTNAGTGVLLVLPTNSHSTNCSIFFNHPIIDVIYFQHRRRR